jgi:hypothetical protein
MRINEGATPTAIQDRAEHQRARVLYSRCKRADPAPVPGQAGKRAERPGSHGL